MCILTIMEHILVLLSTVYPYFNLNLLVFIFNEACNFFYPLKRCIDFVVFYCFNVKFKKVCKKIFGTRS
jgi:hypothetical protein